MEHYRNNVKNYFHYQKNRRSQSGVPCLAFRLCKDKGTARME